MAAKTWPDSMSGGDTPGQGAAAIALAIRAGQMTAREAVEACIGRIEAVDPVVNAVVLRRFDQARREADQADAQLAAGEPVGRLHGVPITIKDQFRVAGLPTTLGLAGRRDRAEASEGPLVRRLRQAGAIIVGKTNVFQLLPGWETDNPVFGRTNNPWDLARTPGGSSGGEAAAVAYGGSQLGLGGDFGGSVRIPAAFCGVCGLKPTAHRLTRLDTPSEPFSAQEAIIPQPGPIAATVEDVALAMEILTAYRPDGSDGFVPPVPWPGPADGVDGLVVGWFDDNSLFTPSPAIRLAIGEATGMLASHGARVVPVQPPDAERTTRLFLQLVGADRFRASRNAARGETLVPALKRNFMAASMPAALKRPLSFGLVRAGRTPALAGCRHPDSRHARRVLPAAGPAAPAARRHDGRLGHSRDRRDHLSGVRAASPLHGTTSDLLEAASYALIANLLGLPAGTVPISRVQAGQESDRPDSRDPADRLAKRVEQDSAGLPVAVQVIGRPWREDLVLAAMAAIERGARDAGTAPALPADPRPQATSDANR